MAVVQLLQLDPYLYLAMIANYHGMQNAKNSQKKTLHFITMKAHTGGA